MTVLKLVTLFSTSLGAWRYTYGFPNLWLGVFVITYWDLQRALLTHVPFAPRKKVLESKAVGISLCVGLISQSCWDFLRPEIVLYEQFCVW